MNAKIRTLSILILMITLVYACNPSGAADLTGTRWELILLTVDGKTYELTTLNPVTLEIGEKGEVGGSAGCNLYFGTADFKSNGDVEISGVGSTEMYCDLGMEVETAFLQALMRAETWSTEGNGDTLAFNGGEGAIVLVFDKLN